MNRVMAYLLILFFISGLFITAFNSVSAASLVEDSWATKAPMQQARNSLGVVAVDSKIYAIGGYTADSKIVGINEQYDPKTDTWITMASMPTPRGQFTIVAYQNKIYCIGGIKSNTPINNAVWEGVACNIVEVYDTVTNLWSTKSTLPHNEANARAIAVDDEIFLVWGNDMFVYNIVTDLWITKQLPELCRIPSYVDPVMIDNKIMYVDAIQFDNISGEASKIMMYNPKTDTWSKSSGDSFGGTQFGGAAVATSGVYAPIKIYALGLDTIQTYDFENNTWTYVTSMATPRTSFGTAIVDDVLYVIGGATKNDIYDWYTLSEIIATNEQYIPLGHKDAVPASKPSNSITAPPVTTELTNPAMSELPVAAEPALTYIIIVAVLAVTIVVIGTSLFFYFNKRKREM